MQRLWLFVLILSGCGYNLRGTERPFFEANGIKKVYIRPVRNDSYQPGIEIQVFNAIRKRLGAGGYVQIVDQESEANATLAAVVRTATMAPAGVTTADQILPLQTGPQNVQIATSYNASLTLGFELVRTYPSTSLWGGSFSRSQIFQASNFFGELGTTSALINRSQFETTLGTLSDQLVLDAEESLNSYF